jgi:hypothetical protein
VGKLPIRLKIKRSDADREVSGGNSCQAAAITMESDPPIHGIVNFNFVSHGKPAAHFRIEQPLLQMLRIFKLGISDVDVDF